MSIYARIDGGVVAELFSTDANIYTLFFPAMVWVDCTAIPGVEPGWVWSVASGFEAPTAPPVSLVPQLVTFRQAKTQLQIAGMWDGAIAAANAIVDPIEKIKMVNLLLDSTVYERTRPELVSFAKSTLGLTDTDIDNLFIAAEKL